MRPRFYRPLLLPYFLAWAYAPATTRAIQNCHVNNIETPAKLLLRGVTEIHSPRGSHSILGSSSFRFLMDSSGSSESGRKRSWDTTSTTALDDKEQQERMQDMSIDNSHDNNHNEKKSTTVTMSTTMMPYFRLEAMFHPKFENEHRSDQYIRTAMKERVKSGRGYLEVTLKHSGSLVLWSGEQRYYSKNSAANHFTDAAEILLRQHFYRAWYDEYQNNKNNTKLLQQPEQFYQDCSDYVTAHRLTLAFEVVTAVLGDHGDIPHRDFVMLTTVACRCPPSQERFFSTTEVIQLAQQFHLPHNDSWIFSSATSVDQLFQLYDSKRETGLAQDTMAALDHSAEGRVPSMYPHEVFQGAILEGFIIRYIPFHSGGSRGSRGEGEGVAGAASATYSRMAQLATTAKDILTKVPPSLPPTFELVAAAHLEGQASFQLPPVWTVDIRKVFDEARREHGCNVGGQSFQTTFAQALANVLAQSGPRRLIEKLSNQEMNVSALAESFLSLTNNNNNHDVNDDNTLETKRIATLIQSVTELKKAVVYGLFREDSAPSGTAIATTNTKEETLSTSRMLCMVHVLHDETFLKFQKRMKPGDMPLFRGFCIELGEKEYSSASSPSALKTTPVVDGNDAIMIHNINQDGESGHDSEEEEALMLKMKLLPYMVRTFICRNHLKTVRQQGPEAFSTAAQKLLDRWGMSDAAKEGWADYLDQWGHYANDCFTGSAPGQAGGADGDLPPLTEFAYLHHLEHFTKLYKRGTTTKTSPSFRGIVVVVAIDEESAHCLATFLATQLGGARVIGLEQAADRGQTIGTVCFGKVEDHRFVVKKFLDQVQEYSALILFGCQEKEIDDAHLPSGQAKKLKGMAKKWRTTRCGALINVPQSIIARDRPNSNMLIESAKLTDVLVSIEKVAKTAPEESTEQEKDSRPGLLVFFPAIPGCGKSTVVDTTTMEELRRRLLAIPTSTKIATPRKLVVRVGDEVGKGFWSLVKKDRQLDSSCICVADKNVPPPQSWLIVGEHCATTKGLPVPVLPDSIALQTTTIEGARMLGETFPPKLAHYYPFSLAYLAVCMARVLNRPTKTHQGKLDSGTPGACMIVVMFYSLYRNIPAEGFHDTVSEKLTRAGAIEPSKSVRLPFFSSTTAPNLPPKLEDALVDALRLQVRQSVFSSSEHLSMELRCLSRPKSFVNSTATTFVKKK
jgi:hypothetical protein